MTLYDVLNLIAMLAAVLLILYLSYYFSKKLGGGALGAGAARKIRVVDKALLGRDKSVVIIRVGQKDYLLGVSQEGVRLLKELEEGQITLDEEDGQKSPPRFTEIFRKKLGGGD